MRVEVERLCQLHAVEQMAELGTDEGRAGVGGVHVHPEALLLTDGPQLGEGVERAAGGGAQSGQQLSVDGSVRGGRQRQQWLTASSSGSQ